MLIKSTSTTVSRVMVGPKAAIPLPMFSLTSSCQACVTVKQTVNITSFTDLVSGHEGCLGKGCSLGEVNQEEEERKSLTAREGSEGSDHQTIANKKPQGIHIR